MGARRRVGIIALLHESNTFIPDMTTIQHFRDNVLCGGAEVLEMFAGSQHEVGGFLATLKKHGEVEPVGVFAARAMPYGMISAECWSELMERMTREISRAGALDGILVAPHGATVSESASDADGEWLSIVRRQVGEAMPVTGTLDLHANVSPRMVQQCQALFGYRTNPHLDQFDCGCAAADAMIGILDGRLAPEMACIQLPLCVNIERQATEEPHGRELWSLASRLQRSAGMLNVSCLYGFPYADVPEMGASVIAVATHDAAAAKRAASEMAQAWWSWRERFRGQLVDVDDALDLAFSSRVAQPDRPVGLLDMGDNVGGGSPGDGTLILHAWRNHPIRETGRLLAVVADPQTVGIAIQAGAGTEIELSVGGRLAPSRFGSPVRDLYRIESLHDGKFNESETRHGGYSRFDQGRTAILSGRSGITLVVTSLRVAPLSLRQITSVGLEPGEFAAIVIKGVHAPVAAYRSVCGRLIRVNTAGVTSASLSELTFNNRRRPMEPFETVPGWMP